jgi:hypothetical protein
LQLVSNRNISQVSLFGQIRLYVGGVYRANDSLKLTYFEEKYLTNKFSSDPRLYFELRIFSSKFPVDGAPE